MPAEFRSWVYVLMWGAFIFVMSTAFFSDAHTSTILTPIFHWLWPHADEATIRNLNYLTRKAAHLTEYFIFGLLLLGAVRGSRRGWSFRWAVASLLIAAAYSAADEFHQVFVPGRNASPWDSLLDTTGAAAAMLVSWLFFRLHSSITSGKRTSI